MTAMRDTLKGLVRDTVPTRMRDDLRPGLQMVTSGRHCIFFEADESRVVVFRVLHDRMDYRPHLQNGEPVDESPERTGPARGFAWARIARHKAITGDQTALRPRAGLAFSQVGSNRRRRKP